MELYISFWINRFILGEETFYAAKDPEDPPPKRLLFILSDGRSVDNPTQAVRRLCEWDIVPVMIATIELDEQTRHQLTSYCGLYFNINDPVLQTMGQVKVSCLFDFRLTYDSARSFRVFVGNAKQIFLQQVTLQSRKKNIICTRFPNSPIGTEVGIYAVVRHSTGPLKTMSDSVLAIHIFIAYMTKRPGITSHHSRHPCENYRTFHSVSRWTRRRSCVRAFPNGHNVT